MKHVMALFCILFSICAHAQFTKGDKFIGGTVNMTHINEKANGTSTSIVGLSPSAGIFLNRNFALGISPRYSNYTYKDVVNGQLQNKQVVRTVGYGVFAKRFFTISDKFFFALTGDVFFDRNTTIQQYPVSKTTTKSYAFGIEIRPSFIFFPSTHWGIEASLGNLSYITNQQLHATDTRSNQFDFSAGTFSLGFSYYLRK